MRTKLGLLLLASFPACVVDAPVAERQRGAEQALQDDVGDWCHDTCSRLVMGCRDEPCDCDSGDGDAKHGSDVAPPSATCVCGPSLSLADCADDCADVMAGFSGRGEECARAGLEAMRCIDEVDSCDELENESLNCFKEPKDVPACNPGAVSCEDQWGGTGGNGSSARPVGGGPRSGVAGTASGGSSGVAGAGAVTPYTACDIGASRCSDDATYLVSCAGYEILYCDCFRNDVHRATFVLPTNDCWSAYDFANPGCGWNVTGFE